MGDLRERAVRIECIIGRLVKSQVKRVDKTDFQNWHM